MRQRLDQHLVDHGICPSREKAKRAILAGQVKVNGHKALKSSDLLRDTDTVELIAPERFVSRGGHKLEKALTLFQIEVAGHIAVDLGASTGGFTDCLLQRGAQRVYAVDVGKAQLAWRLRQDPRVVVMDGVNARHLRSGHMPAPFTGADLVVIDCSFISLKRILPAAQGLLARRGQVVALIKPQFEAGKEAVDQGKGVIRDPELHRQITDDLKAYVKSDTLLRWLGLTESPILGPAGNKEFLCLLERSHAPDQTDRTHRQSRETPLENESDSRRRSD